MAQEYTLQQSPILRTAKRVYEFGEDGLWTPTFTFQTPGDLSLSSEVARGSYLRLGDYIFASFLYQATVTHTTATDNLEIHGLPRKVGYSIGYIGNVSWSGITKAGFTQMALHTKQADTYMEIWASGSGVSWLPVVAADIPTGTTVRLRGSVNYKIFEE